MGKTSTRPDGKTKADLKFEKKLKFHAAFKVAEAQKLISKDKQQKRRRRQKKLKAYDLSTLSEYLPELKAPSEPKPVIFKLNSKSRNKLVLKENNQLKMVISNPAFQCNPLGAIYQHLKDTQPVIEEKPKRNDVKNGKKKVKSKKSKGSSQQSMEL